MLLVASCTIQASGIGFQAAHTFAGTVVGDFNGDGKQDIAFASSSGVSVQFGNGDGTFQATINSAPGWSPVASGDFNHDGKLDLVAWNGANLAVLLGNGDGTFQTALVSYAAAAGPVAIGDFNGDGNLDVVTGGGSVLLGKGDGTLGLVSTMFTPAATSIAVGDFNGDGRADLVISASGGFSPLDVLISNGDGTFHTGYSTFVGDMGGSVAVADLNGDGKLDIAVASNGTGFSGDPETSIDIILGNGDGTFGALTSLGNTIWPSGNSAVAVADFNRDGRPDIAVARDTAGFIVCIQNADGTFTCGDDYGPPSKSLAVGNFNGNVDLVGDGTLILGNGDGTFQAQVSYWVEGLFPTPATTFAIGDFNGDGETDLLVGTTDSFFENAQGWSDVLGGGGGFGRVLNGSYGYEFPFSFAVGDLNGDGKQDVAEASEIGVFVWLGNGDGTFQNAGSVVSYGPPSQWASIADLNGDGKLDIVSADSAQGSSSSSTVTVLLGNGNGTFQAPTSVQVGTNPNHIGIGDVNGDGKADLIVSNGSSNNVSVLIGNGDGSFRGAVNYPVGTSPSSLVLADFNGDNRADIAVATQAGVYLLTGNGDGTFQSTVLIGPASWSVASSDINGDGKMDLIINSGVLYGNGNGTFQAVVPYPFSNGFSSLASPLVVTDLNNDGAPDVVSGGVGGVITVFLNNGGTLLNTTSSANPSSFQQPVTFLATVAASLRGSGTPTGTVTFMDGGTTLGTAGLLAGQASFTTSTLAVGSHSISAFYSGDSTFNPHTSSGIAQTVTQASTATSLVSSPNPSVPGQSVTFTATISPASSGIPTGTATFSDGATTLGTSIVNGSGQASLTTAGLSVGTHSITATYSGDANFLGSTSPVLIQQVNGTTTVTVSPMSVNFGNQGLDSGSATRIVRLKNTGTVQLSISSMTPSASFEVFSTGCGSTLQPGHTCAVNVTFTPTALGLITGNLAFTDNADNSPQSVALSGTGVSQITLSRSTLAFGNQPVGSISASKSVTVTNNTSSSLSISNILLAGANYDQFAIASSSCGASINAHASCKVSLLFSPTSIGADTASLAITDAANNSPQSVSLTGTGTAPVSVTPTNLTFASQAVGTTSVAKKVTIKNALKTTITLSGFSFTGANASDFVESATTCGSSLAAGNSCTVSVTFTPTTTGPRTAFLSVADSAITSPQTVFVTGTGK